MNTFQLVFIPLLVVIALLDVSRWIIGRGSRVTRGARIALWLTAAILVSMPELTTTAANRLGIGRGADLVMYLFLVTAPIAWFHIQAQQHSLQRKLVSLARAESLRGATRGGGSTDSAE